MNRDYRLGTVAGVEIRATPAAAVGFVLVGTAGALAAALALGSSLGTSILLGGLAGLGHTLAGLVHHYGHALAARLTGHPMTGVRLGRYLVLGTSLYPEDEPPLPAPVHIRRALGGPLASLLLALLAGLIAQGMGPSGGLWTLAASFIFWDSLLVYFVGVSVPLGFTDMSTILRWWRR